ncbi:MAG: hypothetical protein H8E03_01110 [Pelagibacteraceae bacterium]|nr:hypothetical protein [Pelagibacteraceae bacterium]
MVGWVGVILLMFAYLTLVTKWDKLFIPIDAIASYILTIHAYIISDVVFIIVNGWIAILLSIKWYKKQLKI